LVALLEQVRVKVPAAERTARGPRARGGPVAAAGARQWVSNTWKWAVAHDLTADNVMERVTDPARDDRAWLYCANWL
jgi:hypothetical protein